MAIALDGVPIDVLAERLDTTRGAVYKTLHDARRKLRGRPAPAGPGGPLYRGRIVMSEPQLTSSPPCSDPPTPS